MSFIFKGLIGSSSHSDQKALHSFESQATMSMPMLRWDTLGTQEEVKSRWTQKEKLKIGISIQMAIIKMHFKTG